MEIANRHVLITGANRGIGRAFARMWRKTRPLFILFYAPRTLNLCRSFKPQEQNL